MYVCAVWYVKCTLCVCNCECLCLCNCINAYFVCVCELCMALIHMILNLFTLLEEEVKSPTGWLKGLSQRASCFNNPCNAGLFTMRILSTRGSRNPYNPCNVTWYEPNPTQTMRYCKPATACVMPACCCLVRANVFNHLRPCCRPFHVSILGMFSFQNFWFLFWECFLSEAEAKAQNWCFLRPCPHLARTPLTPAVKNISKNKSKCVEMPITDQCSVVV